MKMGPDPHDLHAGDDYTTAFRRATKVTVLLPCLNEASSVAACIDTARTGLDSAGMTGEVLVVDNGSSDGSVQIALDNGARVVAAATPGYGSALQVGIHEARGKILVMADADGTYDLTRLGELVEPIMNDEADLVLGSRFEGMNRGTMPLLHRLIGTPAISFLLRRATKGLRVSDSQSGYRAFRADTIRGLDLKSTGMEFASEMLIRASAEGIRVAETPIGYRPRTGESKLRTVADGWRHLQLIVMLAPQLLLFWPGVAMLAAGASLSAFSLIRPSGFEIGSLSWQPIFFGPILLVLGATSALAGAVLTHHSTLAHGRRRFATIGEAAFPGRAITSGLIVLVGGVALEIALFSAWLGSGGSPSRRLALAGLAQSLILIGALTATFGLIYRIVRLGEGFRNHPGSVDILSFTPPIEEDPSGENTANG